MCFDLIFKMVHEKNEPTIVAYWSDVCCNETALCASLGDAALPINNLCCYANLNSGKRLNGHNSTRFDSRVGALGDFGLADLHRSILCTIQFWVKACQAMPNKSESTNRLRSLSSDTSLRMVRWKGHKFPRYLQLEILISSDDQKRREGWLVTF